MLTLHSLGTFDVQLNHTSLLDKRDAKRGLLLIYLAEAGKPQPRSKLAHLLWPRVEVETARTNLRTLLMRMRRDGLAPFLQMDRSSVTLVNLREIDYDCAALRTLAHDRVHAPIAALTAAIDRYHGDFLETVVLDEYPELDEWAAAVRVEMEIAAVRVLSTLVTRGLETGAAAAVRPYAAHLTRLAPFDDAAAELNVRTLADVGEVAAALLYFQQYRRHLAAEMDLEVASPTLLKLVEEISRPQVAREIAPVAPRPAPPGAVKFAEVHIVGRTREAARLEQLLEEGARLISVTGMGGIGKTVFVHSRLPTLSTRCAGRLYQVDCRGHEANGGTAAAMLLQTVVSGLGMKPDGGTPVFDRVCAALAGAPVCLVLDNFETVDAAAPTVAQLLAALPALTVITTTRRALRLKDEAIIELHGLGTCPHDNDPSEAAAFFVQRVRQERMGFAPTPADNGLVEAICGQLGGHPLAIELAAAQVDFYGLAELQELAGRDVTPFETLYEDVPAEHRSLAALLEGMWSQLSPAARTVLAQLSVFAAAFSREAMHAVAPAGMNVYRELHRASLLQAEAESGWFSLHPLVHRYAAQRLLVKGLGDDAHARHSRYFLAQFDLGGHFRSLSIHKAPHFDLLMRTQTDVFLAWENAVARGDWALLERAGLNFAGYLFWTQQPELETRLLTLLLTNLPAPDARTPRQHLLAGRCAAYLALNSFDVSTEEFVAWFDRSLAWLGAGDEPEDLAAVLELYAEMTLNHGIGPSSRAERLLAHTRRLVETHHFKTLELLANASSGTLSVYQGKWTQAEAYLATIIDALSSSTGVAFYVAVMMQAMLLDNRETLVWLIHAAQTMPTGKAEQQYVVTWIEHCQSVRLAQQGDLQGACRQRVAAMSIYAAHRFGYMLPLAYGELALWQTRAGDVTGARTTADAALAQTHENTSRLYVGFGLLLVGVCHWLWGDTPRAELLLRKALTLGLALEHTAMIFSPLYFLVQIHAARLPADLVARVVRIGAVSPALYYALRPLAQAALAEQELEIAAAARETLWATDLGAVNALLAAVEGEIGRLRD